MATPAYVPPVPVQRALTKALGVVNSQAPQVEYLKELAKVCPPIAAQVDELDLMHAHLHELCRVGLGGGVADLGDFSRG